MSSEAFRTASFLSSGTFSMTIHPVQTLSARGFRVSRSSLFFTFSM